RSAKGVRNVEHGQSGGAEGRYQQHELKLGHLGTMDVERLHDYTACFPWSAKAILIASSARTEQWILTGGRFSSCTMSVFLILPASWSVFPFSHSVERLELAMAEPHPKVLNFASTIVPFSTLICNFMTSPHSGAPTIPVPTPASSFLKLPMLRGLLKWSTTLSLYAMFRPSSNLNRGNEQVSRR